MLSYLLHGIYSMIRSHSLITVIVFALTIVYIGDSVDEISSNIVSSFYSLRDGLKTVYSLSLLIKHFLYGLNAVIQFLIHFGPFVISNAEAWMHGLI